MIDTGYGSSTPEKCSQLPGILGKIGLSPDRVDLILLTHLHTDHLGGLAFNDTRFFPNADVYLCDMELDFWFSDECMARHPEREQSFVFARRVLGLYEGKVHTFSFGNEIVPGLLSLDAAGHTPGHSAFLLQPDEGIGILFCGDLLHAAAWQFPSPDIYTVWDIDEGKAIAARKRLLTMAASRSVILAGPHLPFPFVGRVQKVDGGFGYFGGI
jgi:glyoxylase-like metal-dependent hydrolase (beta-lactamase superfamily II)